MINQQALQATLIAGLHISARWSINGTPMDFDFSGVRRGLGPVTSAHVSGPVEPDWMDLLLFGEYRYAEGGGASPFLGIRASDGAVCGLDIEREGNSVFLLNSQAVAFIQSFVYLDGYLASGNWPPADAKAKLHDIDPQAYPQSEWHSLLSYLAESD